MDTVMMRIILNHVTMMVVIAVEKKSIPITALHVFVMIHCRQVLQHYLHQPQLKLQLVITICLKSP